MGVKTNIYISPVQLAELVIKQQSCAKIVALFRMQLFANLVETDKVYTSRCVCCIFFMDWQIQQLESRADNVF